MKKNNDDEIFLFIFILFPFLFFLFLLFFFLYFFTHFSTKVQPTTVKKNEIL